MSIYDLADSGGAAPVKAAAPLFDIPDCDWDEWINEVSRAERARVREVLAAFKEILSARNLKAGAESAALKRHHLGWGWSAKSLLNLLAVYRHGGHKPGDFRKTGPVYAAGDWRVLLRECNGAAGSKLPPEFKRWFAELWAQFRGRTDCVNAAWRHLVYDLWLKGKPVPGYGTIDEWCRRTGRARPNPLLVRQSELPTGWHERNLRRCLPKRRAVRQQVAHGYLAAHNAQPDQVLTDRRPLLPLQYIFLDDSRPDFRCTWFGPAGRGEIVYPLLVMGLDACSGVDLEAVTKPRALKEAEGAARHGVTQDMALRVVLGVLRRFGLPPWKMTIVHENAAGCVPSEARNEMKELFGDRIDFLATGIFREKMIEHGFTEQGGAPYDKAPIESFWRILMTQLARLPGSTGPRYDTAPGELKQIEDYTLGLIAQAGGVEAVFRKFQSPLLDWAQADQAIMDALRLLRFRTRHRLQGFERVKEWRRSPAEGYRAWSEFLALPPAEQEAIATNDDRDRFLARLECPAERFCRLLQGVEFTPVDPDLLLWLEGPRQRVRVRDGKIALRRVELGDDLLVYRETDHPLLAEEHEGREFAAVVAGDGSRIVLADEGRVLGSVAQQGRVCRADEPALRAEMGRVRAARKADREHLRGYLLADTDEALAQLRAHNEAAQAALPAPAAAEPKPARRLDSAQRKRAADLNAQLAERARETAAAEETL